MSEIGDKRKLHTKCLALLLTYMLNAGYQPMIGKDGLKHMDGSLHGFGLATDVDLTKEGQYLSDTEDHKIFGAFWKELHPDCRWGGDFKNPDGNHYSVTYLGKS